VTIILGVDSLNKTFSLKEHDARNLFFFHNLDEFLRLPRCRVRQVVHSILKMDLKTRFDIYFFKVVLSSRSMQGTKKNNIDGLFFYLFRFLVIRAYKKTIYFY
jgi:hypothetical protein